MSKAPGPPVQWISKAAKRFLNEFAMYWLSLWGNFFSITLTTVLCYHAWLVSVKKKKKEKENSLMDDFVKDNWVVSGNVNPPQIAYLIATDSRRLRLPRGRGRKIWILLRVAVVWRLDIFRILITNWWLFVFRRWRKNGCAGLSATSFPGFSPTSPYWATLVGLFPYRPIYGVRPPAPFRGESSMVI